MVMRHFHIANRFFKKCVSVFRFCCMLCINYKLTIKYHLKDLLITLGPVYVKVGQQIAYQHSIFRPLLSLQEDIPIDLTGSLYSKIQLKCDELCLKHSIKLTHSKPIASASISVVYLGKYRGRDVVIKIKKPHLEKELEYDTYFVSVLSNMISYGVGGENIPVISQKCILNFKLQLDFRNEYKNWQDFYDFYKTDTRICIPKMYKECCSRDIIVMDYITGKSVSEIKDLVEYGSTDMSGGELQKKCARLLFEHFIKSISLHQRVHSDLHTGNLRFDVDVGEPRLILYDFGFVSSFNANESTCILNLFKHSHTLSSASNVLKLFFTNIPDNPIKKVALHYDFYRILKTNSNNMSGVVDIVYELHKLVKVYSLQNNMTYFNFQLSLFAMLGTLKALDNVNIFSEL